MDCTVAHSRAGAAGLHRDRRVADMSEYQYIVTVEADSQDEADDMIDNTLNSTLDGHEFMRWEKPEQTADTIS
jgi:hypothetical protein